MTEAVINTIVGSGSWNGPDARCGCACTCAPEAVEDVEEPTPTPAQRDINRRIETAYSRLTPSYFGYLPLPQGSYQEPEDAVVEPARGAPLG